MGRYIVKRILYILPTIFCISVVVFLLVRFIPGDVVELMVAEMGGGGSGVTAMSTEEPIALLKHQLGLDVPLVKQYIIWITNVLHGDLGISLWSNRSITYELGAMIPVTIELGGMAMVFGLLFSIPIGVISALFQETFVDYAARTFSILAISIPTLWLGTMFMVYPSIWWNWTPPMDYVPFTTDAGQNLAKVLPPAIILGLGLSGTTMRMTRTMMLEVLRQDYIRTAWSKGLSEFVIVMVHAIKNAFIPILTIIGNQFPVLIGGSAVLEQIFGLPGMGRYLINALYQRDYPIISGVTLVMAAFTLLVNLVVDVLYFYLDPRLGSHTQ